MDLHQTADSIQSRDDFVQFVEILIGSLDESRHSWGNASLETYLKAIAAWTRDMNGYSREIREPVPPASTWRLFGQILAAARVYE